MDVTFAGKIRELRKKKGMTVYDLAEALRNEKGVPMTAGYISKIEARGEIPSPDMIIQLADALGVDAEGLAKIAKEQKSAELTRNINQKYDDAIALYRKGKKQ